ncbi:survival motor neuron protein 1-like [Dendronephthya gigantea]|uniref:survival motor neuron protein 1-like n=1 Tax=Dendronephthya gigantea TaxID=151771 RepID=UPI00106CD1D1|nr:survival motor neuron protein 1-like [Dendronephthya gigantea]
MAAKVGDVVFKAGEAIDMEEFWDDSALIKAYEKAVNSFKFGTDEDKTEKINQPHQTYNGKKKKRRRRRSNKRDMKSSCDEVDDDTSNWSVGDKCLAVFSEDRLIYEAEIIEICSDIENMCVVRYLEYGNEEQQYLTDLMKSCPYSHQSEEDSNAGCSSNNQDTDTQNWKVSDFCVAPEPPYQHYHEAVINSFSSSLTCKVTFLRSRKSHEVCVRDLKRSCDFNQNTSAHQPHSNLNFIPPTFPSSTIRGIPPPPVPPPPPPISLDDIQGDEESLASMLMSWYLSGYHTGYFKAVQQFKRNHLSQSTNQPACHSNANPHSPGPCMDMKE